MSRVRFDQYTAKRRGFIPSGYWVAIHKRIYQREDGQFKPVGWHVWMYSSADEREEIFISDKQLE